MWLMLGVAKSIRFGFCRERMTLTGSNDWPHLGLRQLPDLDVLRSLVRQVRGTVMGDPENREALDVDRLCALGGFDVEEISLHGAEGRMQALIFPSRRNRFCVYVDPEPPGGWEQIEPYLQAELREHRLRF